MPIYEYACRSCGRRVEVIHGINDPGPTACEACGGQMAKRLSLPSIVFKGSGWAKKDARAASAPKADGGEPKPGERAAEGAPSTVAANANASPKADSGDGSAATKTSDPQSSSGAERSSGGTPSAAPTTPRPGRSGGDAG